MLQKVPEDRMHYVLDNMNLVHYCAHKLHPRQDDEYEDYPDYYPDEDEEFIDESSLSAPKKFAEIIRKIVKNMFGNTPDIIQLSEDKKDINEFEMGLEPPVKYMRITFGDSQYRYYFTFDMTQVIEDEADGVLDKDAYIINLQYQKVGKMLS